jgi:hypothetical protein
MLQKYQNSKKELENKQILELKRFQKNATGIETLLRLIIGINRIHVCFYTI